MSSAFAWEDAWEQDDCPEYHPKYYRLPEGDDYPYGPYNIRRIFPGDKFWRVDERDLIEIERVSTKVYTGIVGPQGEKGDDHIFYEKDWKENLDRMNRDAMHQGQVVKRRHIKDTQFMPVEKFCELLAEEKLLPHTDNGPPPGPP